MQKNIVIDKFKVSNKASFTKAIEFNKIMILIFLLNITNILCTPEMMEINQPVEFIHDQF